LANLDFAGAHPDIARDYVRSLISVNRAIQENPQLLRDAMVKHLEYTPEQAKATAEAYLAAKIWDPNGGLSAESIQTTLGFLAQQGTVPANLTVDDVADLSYLNGVLAEMGRE
jgi:ABC-type nitrate/sulfonate/bicarbonate transport system substrate-binding protein